MYKHRTSLSMLHGIGQDLLHYQTDIVHVDIDHQLLERSLDDIRNTWLPLVRPHMFAACGDTGGEVNRLRVDGDHLSVQTGEEENVIDELQQLCRTRLDLVDKHGLVFCTVLHLEEFCESHDGGQRCADLKTHVMKERVLHHLHLLSS